MDDENVDAIHAGRPPTQLVSSSRPTAKVTRPKATALSTRTTGSGATHSSSPALQDRSGRASPTHPRPLNPTVPMPDPI